MKISLADNSLYLSSVLTNSHISLHALLGNSLSETLRLTGTIKIHKWIILIDAGSTYNFIQSRLVKF